MNVGDPLLMFHRTGQPMVRDSRGMPITVPADGAPMTAQVTTVIDADTVHLSALDATGKTFQEEYVYILRPDDPLPRGGRFALRPGDVLAKHGRATQYGR